MSPARLRSQAAIGRLPGPHLKIRKTHCPVRFSQHVNITPIRVSRSKGLAILEKGRVGLFRTYRSEIVGKKRATRRPAVRLQRANCRALQSRKDASRSAAFEPRFLTARAVAQSRHRGKLSVGDLKSGCSRTEQPATTSTPSGLIAYPESYRLRSRSPLHAVFSANCAGAASSRRPFRRYVSVSWRFSCQTIESVEHPFSPFCDWIGIFEQCE